MHRKIPTPEAVTAFIVEATERLKWMDRELAETENENDRLALAEARTDADAEDYWRQMGRMRLVFSAE